MLEVLIRLIKISHPVGLLVALESNKMLRNVHA